MVRFPCEYQQTMRFQPWGSFGGAEWTSQPEVDSVDSILSEFFTNQTLWFFLWGGGWQHFSETFTTYNQRSKSDLRNGGCASEIFSAAPGPKTQEPKGCDDFGAPTLQHPLETRFSNSGCGMEPPGLHTKPRTLNIPRKLWDGMKFCRV